ncbi:MAG: hypothetical protein ACOVP1_06980 [Bacteroidia bacterium]
MKNNFYFKSLVLVVLVSCLAFGFDVNAGTKKSNPKASRGAKKEAKKFKKEGWYVAPGSLPMELLLQKSWDRQLEVDDKGLQVFFYADGNQVGQNTTTAEMAALEFAKLSLAGQIQTNVSSLVNANLANSQLTREEAASVNSIVQSAKNIIATELGFIDPAFKMYRKVGSENIEVQVRVFYDRRQSIQIAKKIVQKELKEKLQVNEQQLDKLMGLDK